MINPSGDLRTVSNKEPSSHQLRIVFLGMPCAASLPPFQALLAHGHQIVALVLPTSGAGRNGNEAPAITALARQTGVPVLHLRTARERADVAAIAALEPDLIVVACFPWRLAPSVLDLPRLGCVNVHPSLLPVGRGPEPIFWSLRRGERQTGVTIHLMDEGLDTGPILAQARIPVPSGVRAPDLEERLAELGGRLLAETIPGLAAGTLRPHPQDPLLATTAPVPTAGDYLIPTTLPAAWAYDFARGVSPLGGPLTVWVGTMRQHVPVLDALSWDAEPADEPMSMGDGIAAIRFTPGRVTFRRRDP